MITLLLIVLILLQIADGMTTFYALWGGKGREANPVVNWVIEKIGLIPGLIVVKSVGVVLAVWVYNLDGFMVLLAMTILYAYIVHNNFEIATNGRKK